MATLNLACGGDDERRAFRNALGRFATGVTIVIAQSPKGEPVGLTVNSFASVSLDPPLILWSVERAGRTVEVFTNAAEFTVSVLADDQEDLAMRFADAGLDQQDRFKGAELATMKPGGVPHISRARANFYCHLETVVPGGDHWIILGRVEALETGEGGTLLFHDGAFSTSG